MKAIAVVSFAAMVGCAFAQPVSAVEGAKEKVVYSFSGGTDGANPYAGLIDVKGTLYGVTDKGGTNGKGALFAIDPKTGAETVLYSFCSQTSCTDGQVPQASLINVNGTLYGTTDQGGAYCTEYGGCGTVFSFDLNTGAETVVHSFGNGTDGQGSVASLIDVKGTLYGTTIGGGTSNFGTAFAIDLKTGAETVLHSFGSGADGVQPYAGLIDVKGTLYGTTYFGGAAYDGTVFALDPKTGTETVLYSFCSQQKCADGEEPQAGLIDVNGTLYGTTLYGGGGTCSAGCGTVFALDPGTGVETVAYDFCSQVNCEDGTGPSADLIDVKGTLYGTTGSGGSSNGGTVFALDPSTGTETVLHSFCTECTDGQYPYAGVIDVKGKLYGTTVYGGTSSDGTVFAVKR